MNDIKDNRKLIILQGPPASGKTTWAREFVHKIFSESYIIVSRDTIRHSLGEYNMKHEKEVSRIEHEQMREAMEKGINIIINDATNLNPKKIRKLEALSDEYGYEVVFKTFIIPIEEAIRRDKNEDREHHVGEQVIRQFYTRYSL